MSTGYYSLGLTGYEIWPDPKNPGRMMALYVGSGQEQVARSYKIHVSLSGRPFIRPYGRRIYLDEVLRMEVE